MRGEARERGWAGGRGRSHTGPFSSSDFLKIAGFFKVRFKDQIIFDFFTPQKPPILIATLSAEFLLFFTSAPVPLCIG